MSLLVFLHLCCNISHVCSISALVKAGIEACANQTFVIVMIFASLLLCLCVWLVMDSTVKQSIITTALCKYNTIYIHTKSYPILYTGSTTLKYTLGTYPCITCIPRSVHCTAVKVEIRRVTHCGSDPEDLGTPASLYFSSRSFDTVPVMFDAGATNF